MMCTRSLAAGITLAALLCAPSLASGQSLGAAQNFAVVGGSQVTAAVGSFPSQIAGDVGVSPGVAITGFPPALGGAVVLPFILHTPNDGPSVAAQAAVTTLFTSLSTAGGVATPIPAQLAGQVLLPGVYSLGAANLASGGLLTLSGNGTYIFRVSSSLTTISTSNILLTNGAQACNVWWQVGSSATLGGTTFAGNVVALTGANSMGPDAILEGRLLTTTPGGVTLAGNNTINAAFCAALPPPGPVGVTKTFTPAANGPGGVSTLTMTLTNANASAATLTASLLDTLPPGVVVAANPSASTTCGGGVVTATAGGNSIRLSTGSTIPGGAPGSCTVLVNVTSATAGTYTNVIGANYLWTTNGNNVAPAYATLVITPVVPPVPTLSEWAMIMLAVLLSLAGFAAIRRKQAL
jgi:hypothetical protein